MDKRDTDSFHRRTDVPRNGRASEKSGAVYFGMIGASVFSRNAQSNSYGRLRILVIGA